MLYLVTCCSLCQTVSRGQSYPPKLSGVQWFWMTGILKVFQTRNVSMNLSGAWTNNSERVWIIHTPLLVLSCWQLGHRDCILNCLEHYNYFEPIFGSLIFRLISVRWIALPTSPQHTPLKDNTVLYFFLFFFYKAKTCLRSREVLFSQPLCIFFLANSAHSFSHVKIFFLYLGH